MIRIGINGFGRIGRTLLRELTQHPEIDVVAVNDPAPLEVMAHLLKYDSIHGVLDLPVSYDDGFLILNHKKIRFTHHKALEELEWQALICCIAMDGGDVSLLYTT